MVLKFYYDLASAPARSTYFTIKFLSIPAEFIDINLMNNEQKSEEYLKINPLGTVPCIDDDGFVVVDSHAINLYLATKYPQGEKLYPSDPKKRAMVNESLFYESCELFGCAKGTAKKIFVTNATEIDLETIENFEKGYNGLEIYLKKSQYIAGEDLTIADFSVLTTVTTMMVFVPLKKEKFPLLTAYLACATTWPFYQEINEAGATKFANYMKAKNIPFPK